MSVDGGGGPVPGRASPPCSHEWYALPREDPGERREGINGRGRRRMKGEAGERFTIVGTPAQGLAGAPLGFFVGFAAVSLFGTTAKILKGILGLSPLDVGLLVAAPSLSGSLLRIPFSAWVDTTGGRKPALVLLVLSIAGMAGLFLTLHYCYPDRMPRSFYPLILFLGVLCGCGIAPFSVGLSQVAVLYPIPP